MAKLVGILAVLCLAVLGQALTPSSYLTTVDKERLKRVFESGFDANSNDVKSAHYAVLGYSLLGGKLAKESDACRLFKAAASSKDLETVYHAASGAVIINCQASFSGAQSLLNGFLQDSIKIEQLYQVVSTLKSLKLQLDSKKIKALLDGILKKDSSAPVLAYSLQISSQLTLDKKELKKYFDDIEDVVQQADESNDVHLYYENGLFTTAFVVDGIFKLAEKYGEAPKIKEDAVVKFANFLVSRRHTYQLRAATYLTMALKTLSSNSLMVPACVTLHSSMAVHDKRPNVQIRVSTLWGDALAASSSEVALELENAKNQADQATYLNNEKLKATSTNGVYELNMMSTKARPTRGFYTLKVNVKPKAGKKFIALVGAAVEVKVTSEVSLKDAEISVRDREQSGQPTLHKLDHPKRLSKKLHADVQQKLTLALAVRDSSGANIQAQQVFVKFTHIPTSEEVIYVAEPDSKNLYVSTVDFVTAAKEFNYLSGAYSVEVMIGDALIENPIVWHLADLDLDLPQSPNESGSSDPAAGFSGKSRSVAGSKRSIQGDAALTGPKPDIAHEFRKPDKRAGDTVALGFTVLCALPFVLMIVMWMKIGVNMSNFPMSLSAVGFHLGLAGIFCLYLSYWRFLDMFDTLKYLVYIGVPTFLCGNRLLRSIAAKRQKS